MARTRQKTPRKSACANPGKKGETARSKELNTLAVMLAGAGGLLIYGGGLALDLLEIMRLNFSLPREVLLTPGSMAQYLLHSGKNRDSGDTAGSDLPVAGRCYRPDFPGRLVVRRR
nr:hypothetical protein GCM10020185_09820 [Pseudomonas brassicacearum subsp. brassicacearum]